MKRLLTIAHLGFGASPHIVRLAADQAKRGHRVHVISEERHGPFPTVDGVQFHAYAHGLRFPPRVAQVKRILRTIDADVLHSHYLNMGGYMGVATGFHPHVMHAWGSDVFHVPHYSSLQKRKTKFALRAADWLLSPAVSMREELDRLAGVRLAHNEALAWGVDTTHFSFSASRRAEFRNRYGLGESPVVFSPRALQPLYNQATLLVAWPRVLSHFPDAKLLLARYNASPAYEKKLKQQSGDIRNSIIWLDSLAYDELPAAYSACDVMVSIPSTDAPALTVMEAMACERPVVVSALSALRELVSEETGFFVNPSDNAEIAAALVKALQLPRDTRLQMGSIARLEIERTADRITTLDRLEEIYAACPAAFSYLPIFRQMLFPLRSRNGNR